MIKLSRKTQSDDYDPSKVKIRFAGKGLWEVEILLSTDSAQDDSLPRILRHVKSAIAAKYKLPVGLLSYERLKKKEVAHEGTKLLALIRQQEAQQGEPILRFKSAKSPAGVEYEDMQLFLDLFPLNENGEEVTIDDIQQLIDKYKIDRERIIEDSIALALKIVSEERVPVRNTLISQGCFPDLSLDARLEYLIHVKKVQEGIFAGRERIAKYQIICRKAKAQRGKLSGYDVLGIKIPPETPADFDFIAGENTKLSLDGLEISALCEGIAFIEEIKHPKENERPGITVSVEPLEKVQSDQPVNIVIDKNLEILENLKSGSKVISNGEILISGKVEEGATIIAAGNIEIRGSVKGASIVSGGRIDITGEMASSDAIARSALTIQGKVIESELVGSDIKLENVKCCRVTAGTNIEIDTINDDKECFATSLITGLTEQLSEIIKENTEIIKLVEGNLETCRDALGNKIVKQTNSRNTLEMYLQFAKNNNKQRKQNITRSQREVFNEMISTIGPLKDLLRNKTRINKQLKIEILMKHERKSRIFVSSGVNSTVSVSMSGLCSNIEPTEKPVHLRMEGGDMVEGSV